MIDFHWLISLGFIVPLSAISVGWKRSLQSAVCSLQSAFSPDRRHIQELRQSDNANIQTILLNRNEEFQLKVFEPHQNLWRNRLKTG